MTSDSPYSDLDRPPLREVAVTRAVVRPGGLWREVRIVAETGSTNADVSDAARAGAAEGLVEVAEAQSAGRGRLGRVWTAPPRSGLFLSVLLRPGDVPTPRWGWLPLLAGTAARTAVEAVTGVPVRLKWPNDLIIAGDPDAGTVPVAQASGSPGSYGVGRKLGGILVERVDAPGGPAAVLGIGINVTLKTDELPAAHATSLQLEDARVTDRDTLLRTLLREIERWYTDWTNVEGDPMASGLASAYAASCATFGRRVRVELPNGATAEGEAVGLDADGRLVVRTATGDQVFGAGDVVHLR